MEDGITDHYASEGVAHRCRGLQGVVGHLESSDVSSKAMISTFSIVSCLFAHLCSSESP